MENYDALPSLGTEQSVMAGIVPATPANTADPSNISPVTVHQHPAVDSVQPAVALGAPKIRPITIAQQEKHAPIKIQPVSAATLQALSAKRDLVAPAGKRMQALYPIQKPPRSKFVRIHPSVDYRQFGILTYSDPDTNELYYVAPDLEIPESYGVQLKITDFYAAQTHDGTFFIWFVHRSESTWFRSSKKALSVATKRWVRVIAKKGPNIYDMFESAFPIPEPDWTTLPPFAEMLEEAFDDMMIGSLEHPALRRAQGLADDDA